MMEQRTEEWHKARAGLFTASEVHKLMGAKGLGKTGETYIYKKVAEHFGVIEEESFSASMNWGNQYEPMAKEYYALAFGEELYDEGFLPSDCGTHGMSPDSMIRNKRKGVEFKCPYVPANHMKNMMIKNADDLKKLHPEYYWQIQECIFVADFENWDFVSFDPRFTGNKRMFAIEIKRNDSDIVLLKERIKEADERKKEIIASIEL